MASVDEHRRDFLTARLQLRQPQRLNHNRPYATGPFNAKQMGPHTILDEGIEGCLDLIQETAGINALMIYSHNYHGDIRKPPRMLAGDHGGPPREMRGSKLPAVWVKHNEQSFKNTPLRHQRPDCRHEYANRDLFEQVREPAHRRGMKLSRASWRAHAPLSMLLIHSLED